MIVKSLASAILFYNTITYIKFGHWHSHCTFLGVEAKVGCVVYRGLSAFNKAIPKEGQ